MSNFTIKNAGFKYTIPITKSTADEDGLYIYGEATGPEVDMQDEALAPEAIESFAQQIKQRAADGNPVPYLDEHPKDVGRGVLRHLGDLVDGGITEKGHLWVKVRLHEDNPAATFLYRQINAGKQFGMSVSGDVTSWADNLNKALGRKIRTFKSIVLNHIANTTKPVWTPSFGTVLNRAIDKALSEGETMAEEIVVEPTNIEETPATEQAEPTESTLVAAATETPVEDKPEEDSAMAAITSRLDSMATALLALAEAVKPKEATETPEPVTKSEPETDDRMGRLEAALVTLVGEVTEIKTRSASQTPPVVNKSQREQLDDVLKDASPEERLRAALAVFHGEE